MPKTTTGSTSTGNGIWDSVPQQYQGIIVTAANKWGIDPNVLAAVGNVESSYAPDVINGSRTSSTGAVGMFQFEPGTARAYGVNSTDPTSAADGAAHYLSDLTKQLGSISAALQAYSGNTPGYAADVLGQAHGTAPSGNSSSSATATPAFSFNPFDWVSSLLKKIVQPIIEFLIQAGMILGGLVCIVFGGTILWKQAH